MSAVSTPDLAAFPAVRPALRGLLERALDGERIGPDEAAVLADVRGAEHPALWAVAAAIRDQGHGPWVTYSPKVFIPLTNLCRDVCSYCTFAQDEDAVAAHTMGPDEVLEVCTDGAAMGCKEALFCLGDRPEARWPGYRALLKRWGYSSTHAYLVDMCRRVIEETGLLPHPHAGVMSRRELAELREVAPSQGIMLETTAARLCGPGGPHEHAPDKKPATRLAMIRKAGELRIPFTSGILIGIGETTAERIDAIFALRDLHDRYGHIQEVIVQNFRSKPDTPMAEAGEPGLIDLMSACAITRIVMGPDMNIQAPPNLSADYGPLLVAGINDWGGISPLTPDFINPEAPWPELGQISRLCADAGYELRERLTIYPEYVHRDEWVAPAVRDHVRRMTDPAGYPTRVGAPA